jgi:hypothetical protein
MRRFWFIALVLAIGAFIPAPAEAHPADRLLQHLIITVHGDRVDATFAVGGGFLATTDLAASIDRDGDEAFSDAEATLWLERYLDQISVMRNGQAVPLNTGSVRLEMPAYNHFSLAMSPILVTITIEGDGPLSSRFERFAGRCGGDIRWHAGRSGVRRAHHASHRQSRSCRSRGQCER